MKEEIDFEVI